MLSLETVKALDFPITSNLWSSFKHWVIILNRSINSVFIYFYISIENLLKSLSLWSHWRLGNWNETRNASSPGFFLKILSSVFESINMGLDHKLFLQLFVVGIYLFCSRISSLPTGIFSRALSNPFFKSKITLGYPKILIKSD